MARANSPRTGKMKTMNRQKSEHVIASMSREYFVGNATRMYKSLILKFLFYHIHEAYFILK